MTWRSAVEINRDLETNPDRDALETAYALRQFAFEAVYPQDFVTQEAWATVIKFSKAGRELLELDREVVTDFAPADLALAGFCAFYHHDLLVDIGETDWSAVRAILNEDLLSHRLRWPHRFGRDLYDRFNDAATVDRVDHLEADEVAALLKGTQQGVYQVGTLLSGPIGFLTSQEKRYAPPVLSLPLWHCSDTGCHALHQVELLAPTIPVIDAYRAIKDVLNRHLGPAAEWETGLRRLHRGKAFPAGRPHYDLLVLLADALVEDERRILLGHVLRTPEGETLRRALNALKGPAISGKGRPDEIVASLQGGQLLQVLLLASDRALVKAIDDSVLGGKIIIPPNEKRKSQQALIRLGSLDRPSEISSLGVRASHEKPLLALVAVIWSAYENAALLSELGWRLRRSAGAPPRSALMEYVRANDPSVIIRELVLSSMPVALAVGEALELPMGGSGDEARLMERMLWKLGFDIPRFTDEYDRLRARIVAFNEMLLKLSGIRNEDDREAVRSVGVNLFVSVEEFLERLISFNVWLMESDHFLVTRFIYDRRSASEAVAASLGARREAGGVQFTWEPSGGNALGTLLVYLSGAVEWLTSLTKKDRGPLKRHERDVPHYARVPYRVFPFRHTALWADTEPDELEKFAGMFSSIAAQLLRANLASVRNGLDHKRDDDAFPTLDAMLACVARLRDAVDLSDLHRFIPKYFWLVDKHQDSYGRVSYVLKDYQGKPLSLGGPSTAIGIQPIRFGQPLVVPHGNLLGLANAELRLLWREPTSYSAYWSGYPRRRISPLDKAVSDDGSVSPLDAVDSGAADV